MYKRLAITLPDELVKKLEKKRNEIGLNRSNFFRKALESFLGLNMSIDDKLDKKYGPIYESLKEEDRRLSEDMLDISHIPED